MHLKLTLFFLSSLALASCSSSHDEERRIAAITCSIMSETRNMDAAIRVEKMNDAREQIGGEPFLKGDSVIQEAFKYGLCEELVLGTYDDALQLLKDAKRERARVEAGEKDGLFEWYYKNGQLESKGNWNDGKRDGLFESYYENGQLESKGNWNDGKEDGLFERYYENGQSKGKNNWKDGKKEDGLFEGYWENGQLAAQVNLKDGKREGLFEFYSKNGSLEWTECFKNGERTDDSYCMQQ